MVRKRHAIAIKYVTTYMLSTSAKVRSSLVCTCIIILSLMYVTWMLRLGAPVPSIADRGRGETQRTERGPLNRKHRKCIQYAVMLTTVSVVYGI